VEEKRFRRRAGTLCAIPNSRPADRFKDLWKD
jgi:hypothetical protein